MTHRFLFQLVATLLLIATVAGPLPDACAAEAQAGAVAPCCATGKRAGDQLWVVCTRHLGCSAVTEELPDYRVQYFAQGAWHPSETPKFLKHDDPSLPTVVFVHGNRYSTSDAIQSGWEAYHALTRKLPEGQHVRFVVWSWPSDKDGGPIRDARAKVSRTLVEGYYLARLITRINPNVPTSVVGYSFGGRVALGAIHLTGGGQLAGRVLPEMHEGEAAMFRVALLAAGAEDDGLMPGARFEMAMSRTDHLLNLYNPCDPVLKRYRVVSKCEKPIAMGYTGVYGTSQLSGADARITERDVSGVVGKSHNEDGYFCSEMVMQQVRELVLGGPVVLSAKVAKK